jgi:hypothetical protein
MKVFVCTDHAGHYPVGVCSVVIANDEQEARELLTAELKSHGLSTEEPFTLRWINSEAPRAFVLLDGDY